MQSGSLKHTPPFRHGFTSQSSTGGVAVGVVVGVVIDVVVGVVIVVGVVVVGVVVVDVVVDGVVASTGLVQTYMAGLEHGSL